MTSLSLHLRIAGFLLLALAVGHLCIAKRFQWYEESKRLSPFNSQVLLVHAFFIALTIGLMGMLTLFWPQALIIPSLLGRLMAGGLTIFWTVRLYFQWFVYEGNLWRGKRFETAAHYFFTAFWLYLAVLFGWCLRLQMSN